MQYRTINVPPGIGDSIWVMQKLINSGEQFNFMLPGTKPRRGKQIFDLLPSLSVSCDYDPELYFSRIEDHNYQDTYPFWASITDTEMNLTANKWLEGGNHITGFFPDLRTSYMLPWATEKWAPDVASDLIADHKHWLPRYIGIYGSAYSTARSWGFWKAGDWFRFIELLYKADKTMVFVVIGAEWDTDMASDLMKLLEANGIPFINTIGKELGYVIELMKRLEYGFYFPSGLGILSGLMERPSVMWYPKHLDKMRGTYKNPANLVFEEIMMNKPTEMFDFVKAKCNLI